MPTIKIFTPSGMLVYGDVNDVELKPRGALVFYTRSASNEPYTRMTTNMPFLIEGVY